MSTSCYQTAYSRAALARWAARARWATRVRPAQTAGVTDTNTIGDEPVRSASHSSELPVLGGALAGDEHMPASC